MRFTARKRLVVLVLLLAVSGLGVWGALSLSASTAARAALDMGSVPDPPRSGAPILTATITPTCTSGTFGSWTVASPLPLAARNFSMDSDGTYAYAAGGSNLAIGALDRFSRYNPATNTWTTLTPMPVPAIGPALVYSPINNKIYVFGGYSSPNVFNDTQVYDIATGTWSEAALMPAARWMMAAGYYDGKIYLAGGSDSGGFGGIQTQLWEYDPVNDTWDTGLEDVPGGRLAPGYGIVNGHFYVIGGANTSGNATSSVYDYDIAADTWSTGADVPTGVYAPGSAVANGRVWLFGGGVPFVGSRELGEGVGAGPCACPSSIPSPNSLLPTVINITQIYNPASNTWSNGPRLNAARNLAGGTTVGNRVIVSGGLGNNGGNDTNVTEASIQSPGTCPTGTPVSTSTRGPSRTPTSTRTSVPTITPTNTRTVQPTHTEVLPFSDVHPGDYFYEAVRYLYYAGAISGYSDGTFRPYNNTTRGQLCKIVVLAKGWDVNTDGGPHFSDVDQSHPFYDYVETAYNHQIISGYGDGTFRPDNYVARAQLSKIVSLAMDWEITCPDVGHFSDVPPSDAFYCFVETAFGHGIITGYGDGTFHPYADATRGQICSIIYRAVTGAP